jgi:acetylornithine deacetylase
VTLEPLFPSVPPFETPADSDLVRAVSEITKKPAGSVAFGTEGPFLAQLGLETVVLGPGSIDVAHQPDEFLPLDSVEPTVEILRKLIRRYCVEDVT